MVDKQNGIESKTHLGERIATLAARIDAATYELLVLIREFDARGGWDCGFSTCAQWLTWRVSLSPGAARERVRVAHALKPLPLMSEAMKRGRLSYSKVRALTRVARPETEKELVDLGLAGTAAHVEQVVRAWKRIDRTIEARDDQLRDASSSLTAHIDENGMYLIRGRLAPETGEALMKALDAAGEKLYGERKNGPQKNAERPPAGKVRADALGLVAESALKAGLDAGSSGDRYQVVVHVSEEDLKEAECAAPQATDAGPDVPAGTRRPVLTNGHGTAGAEAHVPAETPDAGSASGRESAGGHPDVPAGTSQAPGCGCGSARGQNGHVPAGTSAAPGGAWLGTSHVRVSSETARRIACDAGKVEMTHGNGQVLSVGRKTRTVPPPIRRALEFRDQGCRFPGCTSRHCDAHHIEHWADGGETKLSNLVLLCRRHHRLLHEGGLRLEMDDRGEVRFFNARGRLIEQCPAPPPLGLDAARELLRHLEDAGILITGKESIPAWDGEPMDLRYVMECLWRPPPHLEAKVAKERANLQT